MSSSMNLSTTSNPGDCKDGYIVHNTYDSVQEGELDSLINVLQKKIGTNDPYIKKIRHPNLLITSLIELSNLVGMDRLKDSIALQVMRLVDGAKNGERSGRMLNTILYGPPGVGKTKVGIILAKIWYALGYLKKSKTGAPAVGTTSTYVTSEGSNVGPLVTILLLFFAYAMSYIISGVSYVYNNWGWIWLASILFIMLFVIILLYYNRNYIVTTTEIKMDDKKIKSMDDRELIKVVSRQDFVAEYMGQSAPKTKALLQANLGKVLFIDEAYSLYNGERDQFGMEALTTLNLFMSENPDGIAVIFAGYKDLMKYGVFHVQPGLPRRCMWHFECDPYNGEQLADIFYRQVYKDGYAIKKSDYVAIRKLIIDNSDVFGSYGGDTERLLFYSQLESSKNNIMTPDISNIYNGADESSKNGEYRGKVLVYEHIEQGLRRLRENNINDN